MILSLPIARRTFAMSSRIPVLYVEFISEGEFAVPLRSESRSFPKCCVTLSYAASRNTPSQKPVDMISSRMNGPMNVRHVCPPTEGASVEAFKRYAPGHHEARAPLARGKKKASGILLASFLPGERGSPP